MRTSRTSSGDGTVPGGTTTAYGGATPPKEGASPAGTRPGADARPPAGAAARRGTTGAIGNATADTPPAGTSAATAPSGEAARHTGRPPKVASVIGWTALSAVLPGAAHLRAGWRKTGLVLLGVHLLLLAGVAAVALTADLALLGEALDWLGTISIVAVLAALAWFTLIVHSYVVLRPSELSKGGQVVTGVVAGVLSVATAAPFTVAAQYANVSREALDDVFDASGQARKMPVEDPWEGRDRINILLLGGDWQENRKGVRTDSINLASVDVRTGNTVLFGLPRNLENVRFPPDSPMHERFPDGFRLPANPDGSREDLLFAVWEYAENHPEIFGGRKGMGPETLKGAVGQTLGLQVDWYVLVNIWGFARIIDALGGLTLTVEQDVVFGKYNEGLVKAGTRRLKGADAMWYARSRTNSDDYTRMRRQRCVFNALLEQADPATVLARFTQLTQAAKGMFRTDIPRPMLRHLVPVAAKVKEAKVTSVQFVPPLIHTGYPDWEKIRRITAKAIAESTRGDDTAVEHRPAQAAGKSSRTDSAGNPKREKSNASSIGEGCGPSGTAGEAGR